VDLDTVLLLYSGKLVRIYLFYFIQQFSQAHLSFFLATCHIDLVFSFILFKFERYQSINVTNTCVQSLSHDIQTTSDTQS